MIAWLKRLFRRRTYAEMKKAGVRMHSKKASELMGRGRK